MNSRIVAAFVSRILSMITLPRECVTATEIVAWWTSMPIYFSWLITALLSVSGDANNHNLPQSGRLLYCVLRPLYATSDIHQGQELAGGRTIGSPLKLLRIWTLRANRIEQLLLQKR